MAKLDDLPREIIAMIARRVKAVERKKGDSPSVDGHVGSIEWQKTDPPSIKRSDLRHRLISRVFASCVAEAVTQAIVLRPPCLRSVEDDLPRQTLTYFYGLLDFLRATATGPGISTIHIVLGPVWDQDSLEPIRAILELATGLKTLHYRECRPVDPERVFQTGHYSHIKTLNITSFAHIPILHFILANGAKPTSLGLVTFQERATGITLSCPFVHHFSIACTESAILRDFDISPTHFEYDDHLHLHPGLISARTRSLLRAVTEPKFFGRLRTITLQSRSLVTVITHPFWIFCQEHKLNFSTARGRKPKISQFLKSGEATAAGKKWYTETDMKDWFANSTDGEDSSESD